jgi:hypothetical protein
MSINAKAERALPFVKLKEERNISNVYEVPEIDKNNNPTGRIHKVTYSKRTNPSEMGYYESYSCECRWWSIKGLDCMGILAVKKFREKNET